LIIVADTTPLNYLILIEQIEILPKLYGRVIIPEAVFNDAADFFTASAKTVS